MAKTDIVPLLEILLTLYPNPQTELDHDNPYQLLVATVLSAQCTDKRVNMVTPALFAAFPDAHALAKATVPQVEQYIASINFFHAKAQHLVSMGQQLVREHDGEVPQDRESLEALAGVGRKTANVVMANAFAIPALAVDTHVHRVANRLGWARSATPAKTELQLMKKIPESWWIRAHHLLILHGRRVCIARAPKCEQCPLLGHCPFGKKRLGIK